MTDADTTNTPDNGSVPNADELAQNQQEPAENSPDAGDEAEDEEDGIENDDEDEAEFVDDNPVPGAPGSDNVG